MVVLIQIKPGPGIQQQQQFCLSKEQEDIDDIRVISKLLLPTAAEVQFTPKMKSL
ncbi:MAG: hypothetical protein FD123_1993 [Bacteroidetes bacterium]|nr:MAG: hypothetical protein FD123_1993 [Bacteroidota bacterium]